MGSGGLNSYGDWSASVNLAPGAHTVTASYTTASGVVGAATDSFTLDAPLSISVPDDSVSTVAGASVSGDLLAQIVDPYGADDSVYLTEVDGPSGSIQVTNGGLRQTIKGAHGSLTVGGGSTSNYGDFTYAATTVGTDTFTVKFRDSYGSTTSARLTAVALPPGTGGVKGGALTVALKNDTGIVGDSVTSDASLVVTPTDVDDALGYQVDGVAVATYEPTSLSQGRHTVAVTETSGGAPVSAASLTFTLESVVPILAFATGASVVGGQPVTIAGTSNLDRSGNITVMEGEEAIGFAAVNTDGTWSLTAQLRAGAHALTAVGVDVAGNTGYASASLQVTAPGGPSVADLSLNLTANQIVTGNALSGATDSNAGATFYVSTITPPGGATELAAGQSPTSVQGADGSLSINGQGNFTYSATRAGDDVFVVTTTDSLGDVTTSNLSFHVASAGPALVLKLANDTGVSATDGITSDAHLVVIPAHAEDALAFSVDGQSVASYDPSTLSQGAHTVAVVETDTNGAQVSSASLKFTLESKSPVLNFTSNEATLAGAPFMVSGTASPIDFGTTVTVGDSLGNDVFTPLGSAVVGADGNWSFTTVFTRGAYVLEASDTDFAGNMGLATTTVTAYPVAPTAPPTLLDVVAGQTATGNALTGASDPDGATLLVASVGLPNAPGQAVASGQTTTIHGLYGDLTIRADGVFSYAATGAGIDTFDFTAADNYGFGANSTISFNVANGGAGGAGAPTISGVTTTVQPTTSEAPVAPFGGVTIGDANAGATETLTIAMSGAGGTLSGAGSPSSGVYTLTGTASAVTMALRAVTFTPTAGQPGSTSNSTFTLTDVSSAYASPVSDNATTVSDVDPAVAPTITGVDTVVQRTTSEAPISPFAGVTIGDANAGATDTLTITLSGSGGTLADGRGFSALQGSGGSYTLTGTAAAITAELDALVFTPTAGGLGSTNTTAFNLSVVSSAFASATSNGGTQVSDVDPGAAGDVHMVTFDGLHYDFQANGAYVLARSTVPGDAFQVQIRTAAIWASHAVSLTTAVAAQLGDDTITFDAGAFNPISVDGVADTTLSATLPIQSFAGGRLVEVNANTFRIDWNSGQSLTVANEGSYLDTGVSLGAANGPGSIEGLLGADTGQANDFQLADGTVLRQPSAQDILGAFASSWSVDAAQSLFGAYAAPPPEIDLGAGESITLGGVASNAIVFDNTTGSTPSVLTLLTPQNFSGTIAGLAGDDAIDLASFSSATAISSILGTGASGTTTDVTLTDGGQAAMLKLLNHYAGEFSTSASAYALIGDGVANHGTLFQLAAHA